MSTRGDYTIIKDGHYYSCYQHSDMYADGHPVTLFAEAADIARKGEWDQVIDGWTTKTWVDEKDDATSNTPPIPPHPDGDHFDDLGANRNAYYLRPRLSRAEMEDSEGPEYSGSVYFTTEPSWRAAAAMPTMCKNDAGPGFDRAYGVYLDVDNRQLALVKYDGADGAARIIAAASMDDSETLQATAESLVLSDWNEPDYGLPPVSATNDNLRFRDGKLAGVTDGQWKRPPGFPPLAGEPATYPAEKYGEFAPTTVPKRNREQLKFASPHRYTSASGAGSSTATPSAPSSDQAGGGISAAATGSGGGLGPRCNKLMPRAKRRCDGPNGHRGPCR